MELHKVNVQRVNETLHRIENLTLKKHPNFKIVNNVYELVVKLAKGLHMLELDELIEKIFSENNAYS